MDTSEQYIKMCDCPEIQDNWLKKLADYTWWESNLHVVNYEDMKVNSKLDWDRTEYIKKHQPKWLPRQDQIQEMLPVNNCKCSCCLVVHLSNFIEDNIDGFFETGIESMEQYWLAFYMYEKHQKKWDGKEWIK